MTNINKLVHAYIDNDISIRKMLSARLINTSSLARRIAKEQGLSGSMDAVISAIRRYDNLHVKEKRQAEIYRLLKQTKVTTRNRLASVLIEKNGTLHEDIRRVYTLINFAAGEILKVFELESFVKIIVDEKNADAVAKRMGTGKAPETRKGICEITLSYPEKVTKMPGVFALISQELANNEISIIDSMICHSEHVIILDARDFKKAFDAIDRLTA